MAKLFDVQIPTIHEHLKNIFASGELDENSVIGKFLITAKDGKNYEAKHYNLEAVIALGYRINSGGATNFRKWATRILKDYSIRGYVPDNERLKNGAFFSKKYFDDLLLEIREIRSSERKFYQKITDIYAMAMDYDVNSDTTQIFFQDCAGRASFCDTRRYTAILQQNLLWSEQISKNLVWG